MTQPSDSDGVLAKTQEDTAHGVPKTILYSSFKDPRQGFPGYCASTPPDWKGERSRHWPGRLPGLSKPFHEGFLEPQALTEDDPRGSAGKRARGLFTRLAISRGAPVCEAQHAMAVNQYEESRLLCSNCAYCHRFVGSLRDALARPLEAARAGKPEDFVEKASDLEELEEKAWRLTQQTIPCSNDCGSVFCSEECKSLASREGWHRVLCTDLPEERRQLWHLFRKHACRHQENFITAGKVIAEIICIVKHYDVPLYEAMAFFTRYAKMSWIDHMPIPSRSSTQGLPLSGKLTDIAMARRDNRLKAVTNSLELLCAMVWDRQFAELLTLDFYSNLIGQFSLSNVWVQIQNPLASKLLTKAKEDEAFAARFRRLAKASAEAARKVCSEEQSLEEFTQRESDENVWCLPIYEASGLYSCMALTNHSCRPNYMMVYENGAKATMRALRDIEAGEELSLAYVSPSLPLKERLANLWRNWGFICTCQRCQDEIMAQVLAKAKKPEEASVDEGGGSGGTGSGYPKATALEDLGLGTAGMSALKEMLHSRGVSPLASPSGAACMNATDAGTGSTAAKEVGGGGLLVAGAASSGLPDAHDGASSQQAPRVVSAGPASLQPRVDAFNYRRFEHIHDSDSDSDENMTLQAALQRAEKEKATSKPAEGGTEDDEDEDDDEEEEEEEDDDESSEEDGSDADEESDSDAEDVSSAPAAQAWRSGPPRSVQNLEASLKELMKMMAEDS
eukprot:TRINITY_DN92619_c0_g1_i1.p1 TRINITY_DN92619_c0_g1~~TRINITY_DN92619_c0_g1_i1.p1  ORF type:complete len:733 (-),score=185.55 TRINITY_DN92619_c0_g1_i1:284-2482(-)